MQGGVLHRLHTREFATSEGCAHPEPRSPPHQRESSSAIGNPAINNTIATVKTIHTPSDHSLGSTHTPPSQGHHGRTPS